MTEAEREEMKRLHESFIEKNEMINALRLDKTRLTNKLREVFALAEAQAHLIGGMRELLQIMIDNEPGDDAPGGVGVTVLEQWRKFARAAIDCRNSC